MTCTPIELPFRGHRTYLQGADLYNSVTSILFDGYPQMREARMSVNYHSLLQRQPDLLIDKGEMKAARQRPEFRGEFILGDGAGAIHAMLMESSRPIPHRIECHENDLVSPAWIDGKERHGVLESPAFGTAADVVVALNKKLHQTLLPHITAKWIFVRLTLPRPLPTELPRHTAVRLQGVMGDRMTRSEVLINHEPAGTVYFCTAS